MRSLFEILHAAFITKRVFNRVFRHFIFDTIEPNMHCAIKIGSFAFVKIGAYDERAIFIECLVIFLGGPICHYFGLTLRRMVIPGDNWQIQPKVCRRLVHKAFVPH